MTETRSPSEVAAAIAEDVRSLNYQTRAGVSELKYPSDIYDVVGELRTAAQRLPQLFGQMAMWLTAEHEAGRVAHANGADTGEYVRAVADALSRAGTDAVLLTEALESAHDASGYLTGEAV